MSGSPPDAATCGDLLDRVVRYYLESGDFNGLPVPASQGVDPDEAAVLLRDGLIDVITGDDYLNPHIRPWPSRRPVEDRLADLAELKQGRGMVCLYPTEAALAPRLDPARWLDEPYRRRLAEGGTTLGLAYFKFDVLEFYRNDPRFSFNYHDFGAGTGISDTSYMDESEDEADKTSISHLGFAYDLSALDRDDPTSPIVRRVCAFLCDLARLSPTHQQRWKTYEVPADEQLQPHPVWWAQQMGHWPDGLGPFDRLFAELEVWSELHERAYGTPLLRSVERPREFGWILRPSQHEYDAFIQLLDKVLSENLNHKAFDVCGVRKVGDDGKPLGSLSRLDRFLADRKVAEEERRPILKPFRDVRQARQKPAHAVRTNVDDKLFIRRQVDQLADVTGSVIALREFWQTHPKNADWTAPNYLTDERSYWL